jgi:protein SCO1
MAIQNSEGRTHTAHLASPRIRCVTCVVAFVVLILGLPGTRVVAQSGPNFLTGAIDSGGPPSSLKPEQLKEVSFKQRLDEQLPLDASFKDEYGRSVTLGKYFGQKRPVVLAFVYYTCPMLCTQVMNGISASLRALTFTAGQDFDVVLVSFDPRDNPSAALEKKQAHLKYWNSEATTGGWHFLTGEEPSIKRVADAAGFSYAFDKQTGQYAHVSGILVATPDGRLSRYFYGVEYSPKELRMALVESGQGHIGSIIDEVLLFCYHYDPEHGRYGATVMNLVRAAAVLTLAAMAGYFWTMRRRESQPPLAH